MRKMTALEVGKLTMPGTHWIDENLYLQVTGGGRSWLHRYTRDGKTKHSGLGPYPEVSLADARVARDKERAMLREGIDPIEARKAKRAESQAAELRAITFRECAEAYIKAHEAAWKHPSHRAQWAGTMQNHVYPLIASEPVEKIDTAVAMRVIEPIWAKMPETASRIRGRCEMVIDWAKAREYRSGENPFRWRGHLDKLLPAKAKIHKVEHYAAMPYEQVPAFMAALRCREGFATRALEFLVLTCLRTNEVLGAQWGEFNLSTGVWTVPAERMKAAKEHRVPLSKPALRVIEQMAAVRCGQFVFQGSRGPLSSQAMTNVLDRMGEGKMTVHGFRSSFRDWAAETTAYPSEVVEMALAHAIGNKVEAAYRRGDLFEKRRRLMDAWAEYCARPVAIGDNVVSLRA